MTMAATWLVVDDGRQPCYRPPRHVRGQSKGPVPGGRRGLHPHVMGRNLLSKVICQTL